MKAVIFIYLLLTLVFIFVTPARADIAPPAKPPGSNLLPGEESTQVRMLAETVLLEVLAEAPANSLGQARVSAVFTMHNLGSSSESMAVRFPISANDGFFNYPEITDLQVKVDGQLVGTRRITIPDPDQDDYPIPWAEFEVTFPPGQEVEIEVTYTLNGAGEYPFISFGYLLETGAGWSDTIGTVDLIVQLPYEANPHNLFIDSSPGWGATTPGATLAGREIRWHYDDLEPEPKHNLSVALVMPSAWREVLTEQDNVTQNPLDGEAWGRLGKVYKEISRLRRETRYDDGGQELFGLSEAAYQQAVSLLPEDALWHAGLAELLFDHYYWSEYSQAERPGMMRAYQEIALAYQLNPAQPFILDLLAEMNSAVPGAFQRDGDQYTFLWLTATPTFMPNPSATLTLIPTPTSILASPTSEPSATVAPATAVEMVDLPTATQTPAPPSTPSSPEASNRPGLPLCGAALLFPLAVLFISKRC